MGRVGALASPAPAEQSCDAGPQLAPENADAQEDRQSRERTYRGAYIALLSPKWRRITHGGDRCSGPPAAPQTISVTKYLNPAADMR